MEEVKVPQSSVADSDIEYVPALINWITGLIEVGLVLFK